jgi:hypothetical protein
MTTVRHFQQAGVLIGLVAACLSAGCSPKADATRLTRENSERIELGMTEAEVTGILGTKDLFVSVRSKYTIYEYRSGDIAIDVAFQGGKVIGAAWNGKPVLNSQIRNDATGPVPTSTPFPSPGKT